jgi:hypothetical protein
MDRKKIFLIFALCISIMAKIFLLGKGYLSFPDEFRYIVAQDFIEFFKKGEYTTALSQLFEVQGRPGLVIAAIIPANADSYFQLFIIVV